jgi:cleavage stimulation factor subunit 2
MEAVNSTLNAMNNEQLLELLTQLKRMAGQNPEETRKLLEGNPALSYALFQAMVGMNLIDPQVVQQILAASAPPPASAARPLPEKTAAVPEASSAPQPALEQQKALIKQIMSLTEAQIQSLPPPQRDQVLQLRAQLMQNPNLSLL